MSNIASISEMQKFHFGSKIICSDGEDGFLAQVVFDSATRRMTHLGVRQRRLFGHTVFLSLETVVSATGEGIKIRARRADMATIGSAQVTDTVLDDKTMVENTGSAAGRGRLMLIALHPESWELSYLVVHELRPGQDTLLQGKYVTEISAGQIKVHVEEAVLNHLPPHRPDSVLQREVEAALFGLIPLHIDLKGITARVLDGVLYLDGNISSSLRGDLAERQAMGVRGILEIKNRLVGDDRLASDLAMALGHDSRTRDLPIGVYPRLGVLRLSGAVHNGQQKAAADEIARNFDGVRSVFNDLIVDPKADLLHIMSSSEGGESEDIVPGKYVRHTT
jgi:osmotically-inducible protein OsmY